MIVHYFGEVAAPAGEVAALFKNIDDVIEDYGRKAYRKGELLHAEMGPPAYPIAKTVALEVGHMARRSDTYVIPVAWWATGSSRLFPRMEGELMIAPIGSTLTRVSFQGTYEPPLGALGRLLDRSLLGRVADATVKDWLDRLILATGSRNLPVTSD